MNSIIPRTILSAVSPFPLAFKRQKLALSTNVSGHISIPSISSIPTSQKPQIPLFLRPPTFTASVSDIQKWQQWAKNLALSVGSKFVDSDNGPDTNLLCREVKWLLEDAVEDKSILSQLVFAENGKMVRLRADLDELYCLWKQRIEERRPFQYIVGCEHWRDMVLSVQEGVLIPRPETELIVDLVSGLVLEEGGLREGIWADLGTGSGAIAIGLARILGDRGRVIATDLSPIAVSVAEFNVKRYDLQIYRRIGQLRYQQCIESLKDKVEIRQGSWFEPLEDVKGELAGVVSNPPYIPSSHIMGLQAEVGRHEPRLALDGGENGTDDLLHLCEAVALMLKPGGFFAFETNGEKQSNFLLDFITQKLATNVHDVKLLSDFSGLKRFVAGFCQ